MKVKTDLRAGYGGQPWAANAAPIASARPAAGPTPAGTSWPFGVIWLVDKLKALLERLKHLIQRQPEVEVIDPNRWWEIDAFRGVALVMMVIMHLGMSWLRIASGPASLAVMNVWPILKFWATLPIAVYIASHAAVANPTFGLDATGLRALMLFLIEVAALAWAVLWVSSTGSGATAFLFLMGLSMSISFRRAEQKPGGPRFEKWLRRGLGIFALGLGVTLLSFFIVPNTPIWFGILHLLGLSTMLAYPFLKLPAWATGLSGAGVIGLSTLVKDLSPVSPWWMWLGVPVTSIATLDYAPLLPWFGAVLLGMATGKLYAQARESGQFTPPDLSHTRAGKALTWLGQNSLWVYLTQEPIFLAGMALA